MGEPLRLVTTLLPDGHKGYDYSGNIQVNGGVGQLDFSCQGYMPPGLVLAENSGAIAGKPTIAGFTNVVVSVRDSAYPEEQSADSALSIRILSEPPVVAGDIDGNGTVGLEDAIIGLQVLSGIEVENVAVQNTLTGRVGLDDVIFILRTIMDTD